MPKERLKTKIFYPFPGTILRACLLFNQWKRPLLRSSNIKVDSKAPLNSQLINRCKKLGWIIWNQLRSPKMVMKASRGKKNLFRRTTTQCLECSTNKDPQMSLLLPNKIWTRGFQQLWMSGAILPMLKRIRKKSRSNSIIRSRKTIMVGSSMKRTKWLSKTPSSQPRIHRLQIGQFLALLWSHWSLGEYLQSKGNQVFRTLTLSLLIAQCDVGQQGINQCKRSKSAREWIFHIFKNTVRNPGPISACWRNL